MKTIKTLLIFALVLGSLTNAFGQTGSAAERFNQAKEAFDNSQFEKTLTLLDAMEKDFGKSPRIESLRALTLRDLNRPKDAYLSLITYFKLTEGMNLTSQAHKDLIELRDTLKAQLETDLSVKKDNLQTERNANADKAISETDTRSTQSTQSSTTADPLAELEMWNKVKTSTNANDYYLFLMRFPAGAFAKQAKAKMDEIGDPQWNEVKNSKDPFVFRDYIAKNPNSPFVEEAKEKMNMFVASIIAWEQIKDSSETEPFVEFLNKYPNSTQAQEAGKKAISFYANNLKGYYPWTYNTRETLESGGSYIITTISEINFTDACKVEIIYKVLTTYDNDSSMTVQILDLSDILVSTIKVAPTDSTNVFSVVFETNTYFLYKYMKYKDKNFRMLFETETENRKKSGFGFQDNEKATRFSKDLINAVKVCKLINK